MASKLPKGKENNQLNTHKPSAVPKPVKNKPLGDLNANQNNAKPKPNEVARKRSVKLETKKQAISFLSVPEYASDILHYLLHMEGIYRISEDFLKNHSTTSQMRIILLDWLIQIQEAWHLTNDTLHLCIWILDKSLDKNRLVGKDNLQVYATAALLIACKYEEVYFPALKHFLRNCNGSLTKSQLLKVELEVLKHVDFRLGRPNSLIFLKQFSGILDGITAEQYVLAKYLLELALFDYTLMHAIPSMLAIAALCLSISLLKQKPSINVWVSLQLDILSSYRFHCVQEILTKLAKLLLASDIGSVFYDKNIASCKGLLEKYSQFKSWRVIVPKIKGPHVAQLVL